MSQTCLWANVIIGAQSTAIQMHPQLSHLSALRPDTLYFSRRLLQLLLSMSLLGTRGLSSNGDFLALPIPRLITLRPVCHVQIPQHHTPSSSCNHQGKRRAHGWLLRTELLIMGPTPSIDSVQHDQQTDRSCCRRRHGIVSCQCCMRLVHSKYNRGRMKSGAPRPSHRNMQ